LIDAQHDTRLLAWSLFCRGKLYLFKGQYAKALKQFQLSLILRRKMHAGDGQADCLLEIASIHHALGAPEEALPGLEEALVLYEKTGNLPRWVAARSLQGEVLRLVGDYPRCYQAVADALRRLGTFDSRRVTVRTLLTFAGLCVDKGDLAHAERYLRDAQAHESRGYGTSAATVKTLALLAEHAWHGGRLGAAIECATQGLTAAREIGDPALLAQVLILQAFLLRRLGKGGEARRAFVNALDLAARHELSSIEGWAKVVEGMVLRDEGKFEAAERFFAEAGEILGTHGSERDLAALHLEHGLLYLERGELEEAYLKFEEGLELAKKLHLRFMEARFHLAIGLLDMELGEGEEKRAEENLRHAEDIAAPAPYTEILWRARYQLGSLFLRRGLMVKGEAKLRESFASLKDVLGSIPAPYRESYLRASGAEGLASLLERTLRLGAPGIEATGRACGPGAPVTGDEGDRGAEAEGSVDLPRHEPRAIVV
jgi:tetratricopeptide (TPR) repeat protein